MTIKRDLIYKDLACPISGAQNMVDNNYRIIITIRCPL